MCLHKQEQPRRRVSKYALADEGKPRNLSFMKVAAVPLSGHTARHALHDLAKLKKRQKML